jgi:hypothetical protein
LLFEKHLIQPRQRSPCLFSGSGFSNKAAISSMMSSQTFLHHPEARMLVSHCYLFTYIKGSAYPKIQKIQDVTPMFMIICSKIIKYSELTIL